MDYKFFTTKEVKLVYIFNSVLAGLGILNLPALHDYWGTPIIVITEDIPDRERINLLIKELKYGYEYSEALQNNPENWSKVGMTRLYAQAIGLSEKEMMNEVEKLQLVGDLPEPLRMVDIIAKAIL